MRVSCFHDEWMQHHKGKEMSIRGKWGGVYPIGWLDPASEMAHQYLIDLAKEAMDAGVDEIELDYVRYPVIGIKNADFKLAAIGKTKTEVIRDFVREVHAVTTRGTSRSRSTSSASSRPASRGDIEMLGQDIASSDPSARRSRRWSTRPTTRRATSASTCPGTTRSSWASGPRGRWRSSRTVHATTLVRPWVQAMNYESPDYGPRYLARGAEERRGQRRRGLADVEPVAGLRDRVGRRPARRATGHDSARRRASAADAVAERVLDHDRLVATVTDAHENDAARPLSSSMNFT